MSPASEADDTGRKWLSYQKIPSLRHYLVPAQDRCLVQIHSRAGDLWRERFVSAGTIELDDPDSASTSPPSTPRPSLLRRLLPLHYELRQNLLLKGSPMCSARGLLRHVAGGFYFTWPAYQLLQRVRHKRGW